MYRCEEAKKSQSRLHLQYHLSSVLDLLQEFMFFYLQDNYIPELGYLFINIMRKHFAILDMKLWLVT